MKNDQDHFNVLRNIKKNPNSSQRELADELGFSLGKLNYCLKALKQKGLVKMNNLDTISLIEIKQELLTPGEKLLKTF